MILRLSDEQRDFAAAVRDALTADTPPERLRDALPATRLPAQLRLLGGLGLLGALMPERTPGGLDMRLLDIVAALESVGYAAPSGPWPEVVALGAMLARIETEQAAAISERVASGEALVSGDLLGTRLVPHAQQSEALVMQRNGRVLLLQRSEWTAERQPGLDAHTELSQITWDDDLEALDDRVVDSALLDWTSEVASVAIAAISCGIGKRLLEMTTEYALQRRQFGVPIGSFQAIKHQLVDAYTALEVTRPNVWAAAWTVDHRTADSQWRTSVVRVLADAAVTKAARVALQVHGAIGYTSELPLSAWLKPAWSIGLRWGGAGAHASRMTSVLFEEGPRSDAVGAGIRSMAAQAQPAT